MPNHDASTRRSPQQLKTRLLTRVAAIVFLLAVALLKPKFDAWLEKYTPAEEAGSAQVAEASAPNDGASPEPDIRILAGTTAAEDAADDAGLSATDDTAVRDKTEKQIGGGKPHDAKTAEKDAKDPPGKLSSLSGTRDRYRSTAGLLYVPGSRDGHRLKHVLKHAKDDLSKPIHGVFNGDGDRDQILAWIDIAYEKGHKGGKGVDKKEENGRVVYTVDLGEKIGFVGGQVGKRKNKPPCRYLRLVLEDGNKVVTAYPVSKVVRR